VNALGTEELTAVVLNVTDETSLREISYVIALYDPEAIPRVEMNEGDPMQDRI